MSYLSFSLEKVKCNLCSQDDTKLFAKVSYFDYLMRRPDLKTDSDPILKNHDLATFKFDIVTCNNCGLTYVNPRLTQDSLNSLYSDKYFKYYVDETSSAHLKRQETFKIEIKELESLVSGGNILDVGCGGGFFLSSLGKKWKKHGTEINPSAVRYGRNKFKLDIRLGQLKEVKFPSESFDVVKIRNAIEHLSNPFSELKEIHRILRKNGLISITTPNIGSLCGRLYREKFRVVDPVHHLYYFSKNTLVKMLEKTGFRIKKISYHYFDTPYFHWTDLPKILFDSLSLRVIFDPKVVSPPFYGNIIDVYALKKS